MTNRRGFFAMVVAAVTTLIASVRGKAVATDWTDEFKCVPFYLRDGEFVCARDLRVGDRFRMVGDIAFNPAAVRRVLNAREGVLDYTVDTAWTWDRPGKCRYQDVDVDYRGAKLENRIKTCRQWKNASPGMRHTIADALLVRAQLGLPSHRSIAFYPGSANG